VLNILTDHNNHLDLDLDLDHHIDHIDLDFW